jgi:trimethylamine--corrinoid protein Co-methyltransferase
MLSKSLNKNIFNHFLKLILLSMERDYFYPSIADREEPTVWQEQGALDHLSRAKTKAKELLNHHPDYLSDEVDASIRKKYPILL